CRGRRLIAHDAAAPTRVAPPANAPAVKNSLQYAVGSRSRGACPAARACVRRSRGRSHSLYVSWPSLVLLRGPPKRGGPAKVSEVRILCARQRLAGTDNRLAAARVRKARQRARQPSQRPVRRGGPRWASGLARAV